jgi:hypothetical protein
MKKLIAENEAFLIHSGFDLQRYVLGVTLAKCSWYNWNKRNKTVLHIFMTNSLKPFAITFAGIVLDYKMAIAVRKYLQVNLR